MESQVKATTTNIQQTHTMAVFLVLFKRKFFGWVLVRAIGSQKGARNGGSIQWKLRTLNPADGIARYGHIPPSSDKTWICSAKWMDSIGRSCSSMLTRWTEMNGKQVGGRVAFHPRGETWEADADGGRNSTCQPGPNTFHRQKVQPPKEKTKQEAHKPLKSIRQQCNVFGTQSCSKTSQTITCYAASSQTRGNVQSKWPQVHRAPKGLIVIIRSITRAG